MVDRAQVSNLALQKLGSDYKITDPLDDRKPAREIASAWDLVRDVTLRAHLWNFALTRAQLSAAAGIQSGAYLYRFPLPADFLRLDIQAISPRHVRADFLLEAGGLAANYAGAISVRYVRRVEEVELWDASFVEAFACRLAHQTADAITGDGGRRDANWKGFLAAIAEARAIDGRENPPEPAEDSSWVTARYG